MNLSKIFSSIDIHVGGEPFRIVSQSPIKLDKSDLKENQSLLDQSYEEEKAFLLNEPRGHRGMSGCIVTTSKIADFGLLFFNHDGTRFKYGGLVAALTALLETGNMQKSESGIYKIETIHGVYELKATIRNHEVINVTLESNECKWIEKQERFDVVQVDETRTYLLFPLPHTIPSIEVDYVSTITKWGRSTVEKLTREKFNFDGVILLEDNETDLSKVRSVTIEKDGSITRSANMDSTFAILTARRQLETELDQLTNESIFGSSFTAMLLPKTNNQFSVSTQAFITGIHEFTYDETDPLKNGFLIT